MKSIRTKNAAWFAALVVLLPLSLRPWSSSIKIDGVAGHEYFDKTSVKFASDGTVYVCYVDHNTGSGTYAVKVASYNGRSVTVLKDVSESSQFVYEPDMEVAPDGSVHVIWGEGRNANAEAQYIRYRRFSGSSWSSVQTLQQLTIAGTTGGYNPTKISELRLAVDRGNNLFVVYMTWPAAKCGFLCRYGDAVKAEAWPMTGRSKHPDVAVDATSVHVTWQQQINSEYSVPYVKRPNSYSASFATPVNNTQGDGRPRVDVDTSGTAHFAFADDEDAGRNVYYSYWTGKGYSSRYLISDSFAASYQNIDLAVANANNALVIWNGGTNIFYNWKVNSNWTGQTRCPSALNGADQVSCDLSADATKAAIAYVNRSEEVYLITSEAVDPGPDPDPDPTNQAPIPVFSATPASGEIPLTVTFNAAASYDPDGSIVSYSWDFGDGTLGAGVSTQHVYSAKGTYTVKLTVTDNDGATAVGNCKVAAYVPNIPPVARFTFTPTSIIVPARVHFDASTSSDADGVITTYTWDFGDGEWGSGQGADHVYRYAGPFTIRLIVQDDNSGSASASGLLQAFPVQPPLNIQAIAFENRNLFSIEYGYKISWARNPRNDEIGARIVQYKVYRYSPEGGGWQLFQTVDAAAGAYELLDRVGSTKKEYYYTVTAVDADGKESLSATSMASGARVACRP